MITAKQLKELLTTVDDNALMNRSRIFRTYTSRIRDYRTQTRPQSRIKRNQKDSRNN